EHGGEIVPKRPLAGAAAAEVGVACCDPRRQAPLLRQRFDDESVNAQLDVEARVGTDGLTHAWGRPASLEIAQHHDAACDVQSVDSPMYVKRPVAQHECHWRRPAEGALDLHESPVAARFPVAPKGVAEVLARAVAL